VPLRENCRKWSVPHTVADLFCQTGSLLSLWYATCINSYGYGHSQRLPAVDRITQEKERENTDGPDIARPTGKHGAHDWFLA
jgi:hypothetical protein